MNIAKKGTLISVKQIAKRTIEVIIKVPDDFNFVAGQYIWLMIPELKYPDPKGNTRMFSIASSPNKKGEIDIIFRIGESGYRKTLVEMAAGSELIFSGPYGLMRLPDDNLPQIVLIAGGVGIAPFLSMIRFSNEVISNHKIMVIWANNSEEEAVYLDELKQIENKNVNIKIVKIYGKLEEKTTKQLIGEHINSKTIWSITGPQSFINSTSKFLNNAGVPLINIIFEQFYPEVSACTVFKERLELDRANKSPFFLAVENTFEHIIITDQNGVILYANKGAENLTGYKFEEMKGNTPRLWGGLMPADFYKKLWQTKKYGLQSFSGEVKNRNKNQDVYYALMHSSPVFSEDKDLVGFIATEEGITKLKELDAIKSEFISIASHQLRTPISGLSWLIEALQFNSQNLNQKQKKYLDDLLMMSKRLTQLIEDLLNISRIELKAPIVMEKHPIDIADSIEEFIKGMEPYAKLKKHNIVFSKNTKEVLNVEINRKSLYTILQNLVSNAIDYSPENTIVSINLEKNSSFIKISVSNKGPIIPKKEQAHLFDRFYRGESAKKMKAEGTGLGLYIIKITVEEIGGKIGFESVKDKDTVFWFTIPLKLIAN